jgi:hypothetical protein
MSLGTILLIAVAAAIAFIMYRVGRSSRESAHAHSAAPGALPSGQDTGGPADVAGQEDRRGHAGHGRAGEDQGGRRHGCC